MNNDLNNLISVVENNEIKENNLQHTFILKSDDEALANILRRSMHNQVPIYAVEFVVFHVNTSDMIDTMLAHRLGMCPVDNDKDFEKGEDNFFRLNVRGPGVVYISDIEGFPFKFDFDLCPLKEKQELILDIYLRKKTGKYHAKFCPVSKVVFNKVDQGFLFEVELTGSISFNELIEKSLNGMSKEIAQPPSTFFTEIVKPHGF